MKKRKLKVDSLIYILSTIIIVIATSIGVYHAVHEENYNYLDENEKYTIDIKYSKTGIEEIDDSIKELITQEKELFITEIENLNNEKNTKYSFILESTTHKYNKIYYVHTIINTFTGENHYNRKDVSHTYDNSIKKFINIKDILSDEESFNQLSIITKHQLTRYADENKIKIEEKVLEQNTSAQDENYKHFYFDAEGLNIIFPPSKITNLDNQIKINIPWSNINVLLKEEYRNKDNLNEEEIIIPDTRDIEKYRDTKLIAFTFDDGPNEETTKILLDNLNKYDAKVTFFVLGSRAKSNKEIIKRAYQEGNDIASHTYSHKELTRLKDKKIIKEVEKTNEIIKDTIGVEPIYLRPPYGSINDHIKTLTNMHIVCWNVDSLDWKTKNRKKIKKKIVSHAKDGSIVLVHDIYEESVYGALMAMEELKKQGYSFVTITEMAKLKNVTLDYDKTYYGF